MPGTCERPPPPRPVVCCSCSRASTTTASGRRARAQLVVGELGRLDAERRPLERARRARRRSSPRRSPATRTRWSATRRGRRSRASTRAVIRPPRGARHDVADRQRDLGRRLGDQIDHEARGLLAGLGLGARDPRLEPRERAAGVLGVELGLDAARARRGLERVELGELRPPPSVPSSRAPRAIARSRSAAADELARAPRSRRRAACARARRARRARPRAASRSARSARRRSSGARVRIAPRREVALAAHVEHARAGRGRRQRLVGEHRRHALDRDAVLARRERERAAARDRRAILEHGHGDDRRSARSRGSLATPSGSRRRARACRRSSPRSRRAACFFCRRGDRDPPAIAAAQPRGRAAPRDRASSAPTPDRPCRSSTSTSSSPSRVTGTRSRTSSSIARPDRFSTSIVIAWMQPQRAAQHAGRLLAELGVARDLDRGVDAEPDLDARRPAACSRPRSSPGTGRGRRHRSARAAAGPANGFAIAATRNTSACSRGTATWRSFAVDRLARSPRSSATRRRHATSTAPSVANA